MSPAFPKCPGPEAKENSRASDHALFQLRKTPRPPSTASPRAPWMTGRPLLWIPHHSGSPSSQSVLPPSGPHRCARRLLIPVSRSASHQTKCVTHIVFPQFTEAHFYHILSSVGSACPQIDGMLKVNRHRVFFLMVNKISLKMNPIWVD